MLKAYVELLEGGGLTLKQDSVSLAHHIPSIILCFTQQFRVRSVMDVHYITNAIYF